MSKICSWVNLKNSEYIKYHDEEWWKIVTEDKKLFEFLILEWAQAGLSWETILAKRENYKNIFFDYDLQKIIKIDEKYFEKILQNPGIVRNKLKIKSVIQNAKIFLQIQEEFWSFYNYILTFTKGKIQNNSVKNYREIPSQTPLSENISKDLKKRWMNFVGPTIIYAFLQACGFVNDHENDCKCKNL